MTEQPTQPPTEQDWLGNIAAERNIAARRSAEELPTLTLQEAKDYLRGARLPETELSSIAKLDILESHCSATASSTEALTLMRTRLNAANLLRIAEKESARCEEALNLALAVEDEARSKDLHAADAINEFARKTAIA